MTDSTDRGRSSFFALRALPFPARISRIAFLLFGCCFLVLKIFCLVQALSWVHTTFPGFLINERLYLAYVAPSHWTGRLENLKYPDRLTSADGLILESSSQLRSLLKGKGSGDVVTYQFQRGEDLLSFSIPTMLFGWFDLFQVYGIFFLVGIVYFFLACVVFYLKPDSRVSWVFFLAALSLAVGETVEFDILSTHTGFVHFALFQIPFTAALVLHLSFLFPQESSWGRRQQIIVAVFYSVALVLFSLMEWWYPHEDFIPVFQLGLLFQQAAALAFFGKIVAVYLRGKSVLARARARVVLWGATLAFPLPLLTIVLSTLGAYTWNIPTSFAELTMMAFPLAVGFAVAKHNLFDADRYIKQTVGYVLMTGLVAGGYWVVQSSVQALVVDPVVGKTAEMVYPFIFGILVVFFFNPVFQAVQDVVDRLFFRTQSDYKATVTAVANAMTSLLDKEAIVQTLLETIRREMFVDYAGVFVAASQGQAFTLYGLKDASEGQSLSLAESPMSTSDPFVELIHKEQGVVTKYDVAEASKFQEIRDDLGKRFAQVGGSLLLPLLHQNDRKGGLILGYKKSGHFYSRADLELLETLANQGAIALANANLVEEMRREENVRTNLARYLSPQIVDRIIHEDVEVNLGGGRKDVCILFSDIRDFTSISETWAPDMLVTILNEYFTDMAKIIFDHQGSLDKYIGDAIVAVFGSLISLPNSSLSAARAAVAMMKRMPELNQQWQEKYGVTMDIGIGLNSGEVFLGSVGSPDRMEFTVIGDTVNVASRFSGLAAPRQILLGQESLQRLGRAVPCKELPPTPVKGKSGLLSVYELIYGLEERSAD